MKSWTNCLSASGPPKRLAGVGAVAHHLDRPLGGADRAHAVVDAAGAEPVLGDHEAGAALAEQVGLRDAAVRVADLAVAGPPVVAHHRDVADQLEARVVDRDDDHARPRVGGGVGVGDDHRDRELGADRARGEPLVPVDHPLAVLELGAGLQRGRVRAGDLGLGHREAAADLAVEQRLEEALLLLVACRGRRGSPCCPVSGAEQLKAIGATIGLRPICSQRIPYSQLVRPAPNSSSGRKRFQSPSSLALARSSTRICG